MGACLGDERVIPGNAGAVRMGMAKGVLRLQKHRRWIFYGIAVERCALVREYVLICLCKEVSPSLAGATAACFAFKSVEPKGNQWLISGTPSCT